MNGVGRTKQKLLIFRWNGSEGNNENRKQGTEFHEDSALRKKD
jgi:hypothetical protein